MVKISVVIPVYNVSAYIGKCLMSLLNQTEQADEVILVNDGSTDNSLEIIEEFIQTHQLDYKVLNQKNSGQSSARNTGVLFCTMPYIVFVDSDDYVNNDMIKTYKEILSETQAQVVVCDYERVFEDSSIKPIEISGGRFSEFSQHCSQSLIVSPSPVNKCIAKSLLLETPFVEGIRYEDLATIPIIMYNSKKSVKVDRILYYYTTRNSDQLSTMQKVDDGVFDLYIALDNVVDAVGGNHTESILSLYIQHLLIYNIGIFLKHHNGVENLKHNVSIMDAKFTGWYRKYNRQDFAFHERVIILMYRLNLFFLISFLYKKIRK